ncbi:MAG: peptide chain release factor N(5)-glutamine methyltransferase [Chitinophagales bacterium]
MLIPRPETEELCALVIKENTLPAPRILDIGCGSGCIAITLKKEIPDAEVYALDISKDALDIAERNASSLEANVHFIQADILKENPFTDLQFDIIVSNPPYIPHSDKASMHKNVLAYEPELALFPEGDDALVFYRRIAELGKIILHEQGKMYLEIHHETGREAEKFFKSDPYSKINISQDLSGKDRILQAELRR